MADKVLSEAEFATLPEDNTQAPVAAKQVLSEDEFQKLGDTENAIAANNADRNDPNIGLELHLFDTLKKGTTDFFENIGESFKQGNDDSHLDMLKHAAWSGNLDYATDIVPLQEKLDARKATNPVEGNNILSNAIYNVAGMLPAMGKGMLEGAKYGMTTATGTALIPGAQPLVPEAFVFGQTMGSMNYWTKQGTGNIYGELKKADVPDEIAKPVAGIAGPLYAGIEFLQVDRLAPGTGVMVKRAVTKSATKIIKEYVKRYGKDWAIEVGEEGLQSMVQEIAQDAGTNIAGKTNYGVFQFVQRALDKGISAAKQSALPMLLMLGPSAGINIARTVKAQNRLKVLQAVNKIQTEVNGKLVDAVVEKATAAAESGKPMTDEEILGLVKTTKQELLQKELPKEVQKESKQIATAEDFKGEKKAENAAPAEKPAEGVSVEEAASQATAFDNTRSEREKLNFEIKQAQASLDEAMKDKSGAARGADIIERTRKLEVLQKQSIALYEKEGEKLNKKALEERTGQKDISEAKTLSERVLLQMKLRAEERGAKAGFKAGYAEARETALETINSGKDARKAVGDYLRLMLPTEERGRFMAMLANAKDEGDVAEAFIKIEARGEQVYREAIAKDVEKIADRVANSNTVNLDYKKKVAALFAQYERRIAADENGYSTSQMDGLLARMEMLQELGRVHFKLDASAHNAEQLRLKEDLLSTAQPVFEMAAEDRKPGAKKKLTQEAMNGIKDAVNGIVRMGMGLTPIDGLAIVTGMGKMKAAGDFHFGNYLSFNDGVYAERNALVEKHGLTYLNFERIGTYAAKMQEGGYEKLANIGISKEEADAIALTPEEKEFYDFVRRSFDEIHPQVKALMKRVYNRDVKDVANYVSFLSDPEHMRDEFRAEDRIGGFDELAFLAQEQKEHRTKNVDASSTISRTGAGKQKIMTNINDIFNRHMDDTAYLLNMSEFAKNHFEIVNSPEMRAKLGNIASNAWLDWLDLVARKGGAEHGRTLRWLDNLRRNMGAGMLPYRLSSALIQFSSLPGTVTQIGEKWTTHGIMSLHDPAARAFITDHFPEIAKEIGGDPAYQEMESTFLGKVVDLGLNRAVEAINNLPEGSSKIDTVKTGMAGIKALDGLMRKISALGAYGKLAAEKGVEVDYSKPDRELIEAATRIVRESQGSSFFIHQPLALTKGYFTGIRSLDKSLLQFGSFNLFSWGNLVNRVYQNGIKKGDFGKALHAAVWLLALKAAQETLIRGGTKRLLNAILGREQKKDKHSFLYDMMMTNLGNIPIMGTYANALLYGSNPVPLIALEEKIRTSGIKRAIVGKKTSTKAKGVATALGGLAWLAGAPGVSTAMEIVDALINHADRGSTAGRSLTE